MSCPTTHKSYTVYLKKFVIFVKADDYLIGDMSTMIPTLACFFYDLGRVCEYKPHVKKSCLAAINFGIQYHHLKKFMFSNTFILICILSCNNGTLT